VSLRRPSSVSCGFKITSVIGRNSTEEVAVKTMALRLEDDLHAQLAVLAQLSGVTITEVLRSAIETWVDEKRRDPALVEQADSVIAEIDSAAQSRRDAIASLFAGETAPEPTPSKGRRGRPPTS